MNIGIIGLGARSQAYVINIPKFFSQHKIISVCEKDEERLENYTEHYFKDGMPDKYTDFNEMLKDERLDAVVITTPDYAHLEVVSAAMDRNLNIILEKPIEASAERALAIYEKAKDYQKVIKLGFVLRYTPIVKKLKELIGSEEIGDIISISASGIALAALFASSTRRATPSDIFAEKNTGIFSAARRIEESSSSVCPVVAITVGIPFIRAKFRSDGVCA